MDEAENAFTLKDVQDADVLKKALMTLTPKHAVVVGGGFGGLAMAENLQRLGLTVTIVEKSGRLWEPLILKWPRFFIVSSMCMA